MKVTSKEKETIEMDDKALDSALNNLFAHWKTELLPLLAKQLKDGHTPLEVLLSIDDWTALRNNPALLILLNKQFPELRRSKKLKQLFDNADRCYKGTPMILFYLDPATYTRHKWVKVEYDRLDSQGTLADEFKKLKETLKLKKIKRKQADPIKQPFTSLTQKESYGFFYSFIKGYLKDSSQKNIIEFITSLMGYSPTKAYETIKSETLAGLKELNNSLPKTITSVVMQVLLNSVMAIFFTDFLKEIMPDKHAYNIYMKQRCLLFKRLTISYDELLAWIQALNEYMKDNDIMDSFKKEVIEPLISAMNNLTSNLPKTSFYKESIRQEVLNDKNMMILFNKETLNVIKDIDFENTKPEYFKESPQDRLNKRGEINKIKFDALYNDIKKQDKIDDPFYDIPEVKNVLSKLSALLSLKDNIKPYKGRKTLLSISSIISKYVNQQIEEIAILKY